MNAQDLLDTFERLRRLRHPYEQHWRDVEDVVPPFTRRQITSHGDSDIAHGYNNNRAVRNRRKSQKRYDTTMMRATERLTAGIYSLVFPNGQKWQKFSVAGPTDEETHEEKVWAEKYRDLLFHYRYLPKARFEPAIQAALYSSVTYGPGYVYTDPTFDPHCVMRYRPIPVDEAFLDKDEFGEVYTFAQRTRIQAVNVRKDWDVSDKVTAVQGDPKRQHEEFEFIKVILPRKDKERTPIQTSGYTDYVGYTVEVAQKRIVKEEAYEEFPVACFFWDDTFGLYGTSPCINYLLDQRMLNAMEKDVLIALQTGVRPPTGGPDTGLLNRVNLTPGAHNPGAVGPDGSPLIVPLNLGGNPERAVPFMEQRRTHLNDGFYTTLFQMLVERSGQTATEVLQRANEKGQLLGPVGARLHGGANVMTEREQEALRRRGVFADNSPYLPPASLEGRDVRPIYTNPMVRLQMSSQAEGTLRMMEIDNQRAQAGRQPMLKDHDAMQFLGDAFDVPAHLIKSDEEVDQERQQREQQENAQQMMAMAESAAKASKDAMPMMEAVGAVPPQ